MPKRRTRPDRWKQRKLRDRLLIVIDAKQTENSTCSNSLAVNPQRLLTSGFTSKTKIHFGSSDLLLRSSTTTLTKLGASSIKMTTGRTLNTP